VGTASRKREEGFILRGRGTKKEAVSEFGTVHCRWRRIPLIQLLQPFSYDTGYVGSVCLWSLSAA
jgi:hypothetical protein